MEDPNALPLIQTFSDTWTKEQKIAVATLCVQALDYLSSQHALGHEEAWRNTFLHDVFTHLGVVEEAGSIIRASRVRPTNRAANPPPDPATVLFPLPSPPVPGKKPLTTDIRTEVLVDLLAVSLGLNHRPHVSATTFSRLLGTQNQAPYSVAYDARSRAILFRLALLMRLDTRDVITVEKSIGQHLYFKLEEQRAAQVDVWGPQESTPSSTSIMDEQASRAMDDLERRKKKWRWFATGAGVVGGAAIIGLTGGLAAPIVAPLVAGFTGASFFATTGGIALLTGVFGLTGGGLAGWKMHRRTRGITDFSFTQIVKDPTLPPIPSLHLTICISGYLIRSKDEVMTPWRSTFIHTPDNRDTFCLEFETEVLLRLGNAFQNFIASEALKYGGAQLVGRTALAALFAALVLPATLLKATDIIDNPWQLGVDRAKKAGLVLADVLQEHVQGKRPVMLIGYSLGALVIWSALKELARRDGAGIVDTVILVAAPIPAADLEMWEEVTAVVARRVVNCWSDDDWVLAVLHRMHSLTADIAGLAPVALPRVENVDVSKIVGGHQEYKNHMEAILKLVGID